MSAKDSIEAIRQLVPIRQRRLERAETAVREAELAVKRAKDEVQAAQEAYDNYVEQLPKLISDLYASVMHTEISKNTLSELTKKEGVLRAKVEDFKASLEDAKRALEEAQQALAAAHERLRKETVKLDVLKDLEKIEVKKVKIEEEQKLGRAIDELASAQYVRRRLN